MNCPAQMAGLHEDIAYFLTISVHSYLPCWGMSLDLQRIKTSGFVSTGFRITRNPSKQTTKTSTAKYKRFSKRGTSLSPLPSCHLLVCVHRHEQARVAPHIDSKNY